MRFKWYSRYRLFLFDKDRYPVIAVKDRHAIFIHINKTAGTSILTAFGKRKFHLSVRELISLLGERDFSNAYKFTVVRNPYLRVISQYKHLIKTNQNNLRNEPLPFDEWVGLVYGKKPDSRYHDKPRMFMKQVDWLKDDNGTVRVDRILKFENLNYDFLGLTKDLGVTLRLPRENTSELISMPELSDGSREIILAYFREDFEYFGYSPDYLKGS